MGCKGEAVFCIIETKMIAEERLHMIEGGSTFAGVGSADESGEPAGRQAAERMGGTIGFERGLKEGGTAALAGEESELVAVLADRHAAGFVVGGDDEERFIGVISEEVPSGGDGLIERECFADDGGGVVEVRKFVNTGAFNHEEEAGRIV